MASPLPVRRSSVLLLVALALTLAGCGGKNPVTTVTGKVTVGGTNPLPGGNITFFLISDPTQVGGAVINSDGTFEVVNAPVGECKVVVDNTNLDTSKSASGMGGGGGMMGGGGKMGGGGGMMGGAGMGAQAQAPSAAPGSKEKMKNASAKAAELAPDMAPKDTGTKKYVKIDPGFTKAETTSLRYKVTSGDNINVTFDVR